MKKPRLAAESVARKVEIADRVEKVAAGSGLGKLETSPTVHQKTAAEKAREKLNMARPGKVPLKLSSARHLAADAYPPKSFLMQSFKVLRPRGPPSRR